MTNRVRTVSALLLAFGAAACQNALQVTDQNNPDFRRVFSQPASIEQAIGSGYQVCRNSTSTNMSRQMGTMSGEWYSGLNNYSMGPRGGIPRSPILNNKAAQQAEDGTFSAWSRNARTAANAVHALDDLVANGGTLGSPAQNARARAMGFLDVACDLGWLGLSYDSGGIVDHQMASDSVPPLSHADDVIAAAVALLDSAIASANSGASAFPTPSDWFSGMALTKDQFVRLVHSWKARLEADVARTPAERAAVNWDQVIADANAGLNYDLLVNVGGTSGWSIRYEGFQMYVDAAWSQIGPMYWGFADAKGMHTGGPTDVGYEKWLALDINSRPYFLIYTPDLRFPQGATRVEQQGTCPETPGSYTDRPYIVNRCNSDTPAEAWGSSYYDAFRYKYIAPNREGLEVDFLQAENDLLAAEGYIRKGQIAQAAALIDRTRVGNGGLPALTGAVSTASDPAPGGTMCVPQVPDGANGPTHCGDIMEAMKYEYRTEIAFSRIGAWFYSQRGWGDLFVDTPLEYPVPVTELDARQLPYYNLGGGGPSSAALGTYKFP